MLAANTLAIISHGDDLPRCETLARQLGIAVSSPEQEVNSDFSLAYIDGQLTLSCQRCRPAISIHADWVKGKAAWRRGQPELISKAIGSHRLESPHIVDATAGLGRDSLVLASLPARSGENRITAIERSAVVHALLQDAHQRALQAIEQPALVETAKRILLQQGDSSEQLGTHEPGSIDIVYLDPMYPARQKKAQVKKDMRVFQELLGEATLDHRQLLQSARDAATYRVVVKRPLKGDHLAGESPSFSIKGRSTRFDVYTRKKLP